MKWEAKHKYLAYLILSIISLLVYSNSLQNGFVYDDHSIIVENEYIRDWHNLFSNFSLYRPIRWVTYTIDYHLWGLNPLGYHLTNLLLHIACTLLLYFSTCVLFKNRSTPLIIGLLFAVHPINTEVVNGISNRNDLLVTLFLLLSFTLYMKKDRSILFYILSFLSFLFGLLSKEAVAITIPLVLVGYDLYFTPKTKILQIIRKNIKYYIPYGILPVLYVMLGSSHLGLSKRVTTVFQDLRVAANIAGASEIAIFGIWCKAVPQYLRLLFLPYNLCAAYPISCPSSIFEISVLLSFFLCIVFIVFIVKSYKYCSEASFGLFWILATLLPVLNIIPVTPHFLAERYLYAPSIGFCIFIAVMINKIYYQQIRIFSQGFQKKFAVFLILMVLVLYSLLTFQRNLDWKSDYTLWSKTVCQKPESGIAHWNLAVVYDSEGQYDKAIEEFKKVIPFYPRNALLHYGLGTTYLRKGLYDEAVKELKQALQINPKLGDAYCNLGVAYLYKGSLNEAINQLKKAIEINPRDGTAHFNLVIAYLGKGLNEEAMEEYQKAIEIDARFAKSQQGLQVTSWLKNLQKR